MEITLAESGISSTKTTTSKLRTTVRTLSQGTKEMATALDADEVLHKTEWVDFSSKLILDSRSSWDKYLPELREKTIGSLEGRL
jgi:hypothetical protein